MSKAYKISLALLVLLLVFLTWLEANEPQKVNWSPSYAALDKIPLGTKVLFKNLKQQDIDLQEVNIPPYEFLNDSTISGTYFFLNNSLGFDEPELKRILTWVARGNTAFFIAENFSQNLLDTGIGQPMVAFNYGLGKSFGNAFTALVKFHDCGKGRARFIGYQAAKVI